MQRRPGGGGGGGGSLTASGVDGGYVGGGDGIGSYELEQLEEEAISSVVQHLSPFGLNRNLPWQIYATRPKRFHRAQALLPASFLPGAGPEADELPLASVAEAPGMAMPSLDPSNPALQQQAMLQMGLAVDAESAYGFGNDFLGVYDIAEAAPVLARMVRRRHVLGSTTTSRRVRRAGRRAACGG